MIHILIIAIIQRALSRIELWRRRGCREAGGRHCGEGGELGTGILSDYKTDRLID